MARALPADWDIDIVQATNGEECLDILRQTPSDILFLDLNMPGLDGYQVLESIRKEDLKTMTIVVSGDIQPEARERVQKLGAMEFIKKPISVDTLTKVLDEYGLLSIFRNPSGESRSNENIPVDIRDGYREITNISMGRATDLLARYLNTFIAMPVPSISTVEISDVQMILRDLDTTQRVSSLCQGFIAPDVAGEAMLIFRDTDFSQIARDLEFESDDKTNIELEIQMEIASILFGAFIGGMRDQFKTGFSQGHPIVLGQHITISELLGKLRNKWQKTLCIEMSYEIEKYQFRCDLIIFFAESSIEKLENKIKQLIA